MIMVRCMSLETEMQELRSKQETLDHALQELMKVVGGTHEVVTLVLKDQLEMHKEIREHNKRFYQLSNEIPGSKLAE